MLEKKEVQQRLQRIESLVGSIESSADPVARSAAVDLTRTLMDLHGAGIERMMEMVFETGAAGGEIIDRFAQDDLVSSLLLLYGLHPLDIETRVSQALDKVRPYLRSHGGDVELLGIAEGVARLKMQGSCNGCASSALTLKLAIEEAIYDAAPDVTSLEVEGVTGGPQSHPTSGYSTQATSHATAQAAGGAASRLVQLERAPAKHGPAAAESRGWAEVRDLVSVRNGAVRHIEVSGRSVLFCRLGETFYAYSDTCPDCGHALRAATLEASAVVCPGCRQRFDVMRAGRGLDKPDLHLQPFPLLIENGQAKVALPA
jgi:Fe-S cluster biogenesis protein NfuA/nitrite reductase/ring-hydroxylating ferredoxin subunit